MPSSKLGFTIGLSKAADSWQTARTIHASSSAIANILIVLRSTSLTRHKAAPQGRAGSEK